jgi:hypothetical protein
MPRKKKETATLSCHDNVVPVFDLDDVLMIDAPATKHHRLIVAGIRQYAGGPFGPMVDYVFEGDPDSPQVRLRLLPNETGKARLLVLTLYDSLPYNEGLHDVVRGESATLRIHDDTDSSNIPADIFWRINDVAASHIRSVNIRSNIGVTDTAVEYWDYSRLIDNEGVETEEFIFVEMDAVDRAFQIWRGVDVAPDRIAAG